MTSYRGMWNFLAGHDLCKKVNMIFRPDDDPAGTLLLEPRALHRKISDGVWLRIVDVDKALAARGYDLDGEVTFTVSDDDLCPWNNATWAVVVKDGEANVTKTDASSSQFEITTTALASLFCGYSTASELERSGRIVCDDKEALRKVDALFSTRLRPNCTNMF